MQWLCPRIEILPLTDPHDSPPDDCVRQLARLLRGHRLEAQGGAVAEAL
jgi:hypothetical protein